MCREKPTTPRNVTSVDLGTAWHMHTNIFVRACACTKQQVGVCLHVRRCPWMQPLVIWKETIPLKCSHYQFYPQLLALENLRIGVISPDTAEGRRFQARSENVCGWCRTRNHWEPVLQGRHVVLGLQWWQRKVNEAGGIRTQNGAWDGNDWARDTGREDTRVDCNSFWLAFDGFNVCVFLAQIFFLAMAAWWVCRILIRFSRKNGQDTAGGGQVCSWK